MRTCAFTLLLAVSAPFASAQDASEGAALYAMFCATCHGREGRGDGPTAAILRRPPADLSNLSMVEDGRFPRERVVARIDGREPFAAHGGPMPLFGSFFAGRPDRTGETLTPGPIADLTAFLEQLQVTE